MSILSLTNLTTAAQAVAIAVQPILQNATTTMITDVVQQVTDQTSMLANPLVGVVDKINILVFLGVGIVCFLVLACCMAAIIHFCFPKCFDRVHQYHPQQQNESHR